MEIRVHCFQYLTLNEESHKAVILMIQARQLDFKMVAIASIHHSIGMYCFTSPRNLNLLYVWSPIVFVSSYYRQKPADEIKIWAKYFHNQHHTHTHTHTYTYTGKIQGDENFTARF